MHRDACGRQRRNRIAEQRTQFVGVAQEDVGDLAAGEPAQGRPGAGAALEGGADLGAGRRRVLARGQRGRGVPELDRVAHHGRVVGVVDLQHDRNSPRARRCPVAAEVFPLRFLFLGVACCAVVHQVLDQRDGQAEIVRVVGLLQVHPQRQRGAPFPRGGDIPRPPVQVRHVVHGRVGPGPGGPRGRGAERTRVSATASTNARRV
ncbi:hypothetical protein SMD44_p10089 (plasmid) [Streptomyces alboflavus]|uniref:Uncharacterized protein n=1 Tax=Streptomyces alboflavus TaxID=67267 RepID=A0A291W3I9_9ACTN|nr:hypothetical protein [Streptomyces alboflavus]ATM24588.1 hypothetical protein SMD44_p10089 [Streptomyces alboflavus]